MPNFTHSLRLQHTAFVVTLSLVASCQSTPGSSAGPNRAQVRNLMSPWSAAQGEAGWTYDVAVGVEVEPEYAGSDDSSTEAGLFARALYEGTEGHRYFVSLGEVGAWWQLSDDWVLGTIAEFEPGREDDNSVIEDFEEVDDTVEAQISLIRRLDDWSLGAVLQVDALGRGKGVVGFLVAGFDRMLTDQLRFGVQADISTGDSEYMMTEFGVSSRDAAASGLPEFDPGAGMKSTTIDIGLEYFFRPGFSAFANIATEYYFSDASDSPLIEDEGSDLTHEFMAGLRYSF